MWAVDLGNRVWLYAVVDYSFEDIIYGVYIGDEPVIPSRLAERLCRREVLHV